MREVSALSFKNMLHVESTLDNLSALFKSLSQECTETLALRALHWRMALVFVVWSSVVYFLMSVAFINLVFYGLHHLCTTSCWLW